MKNSVLLIYFKEIRETLRDRRTVFTMIISPLIVMPAFFGLIGGFISHQAAGYSHAVEPVAVIGASANDPIVQSLSHDRHLILIPMDPRTAQGEMRSHHLRAALILPLNTATLLKNGTPIKARLIFDPASGPSRAAADRIRSDLQKMERRIVRQRLLAKSLNPDLITPLKIETNVMKGSASLGNMFLGGLLPYIIVLSAFFAGVAAAFDQVAGEKERGTLETILVAPTDRRSIVLGKFLAVFTVSLVAGISSIAGLVVALTSGISAFRFFAAGGVSMSPKAAAVTFLVVVPICVLFAAVLITVSTFARNQKEAQMYLLPLSTAVTVPAVLSLVMSSEVSQPISLIPVLGSSLIIKQAMMGIYDPVFISLAIGSSTVYAGCALWLATAMFRRESVLLKA